MIVFDLQCINGHVFEGWFDDGESYEDQRKKSLISCPLCNSTSVFKIPSTFGIKSSSQFSAGYEVEPSNQQKDLSEKQKEIELLAKKVIDYIDKNFENVGCDFAKEALKIHYGTAEPRNIKGISTDAEEKVLKNEGIEFFKFPKPEEYDKEE